MNYAKNNVYFYIIRFYIHLIILINHYTAIYLLNSHILTVSYIIFIFLTKTTKRLEF